MEQLRNPFVYWNPVGDSSSMKKDIFRSKGNEVTNRPSWATLQVAQSSSIIVRMDKHLAAERMDWCSFDRSRLRICKQSKERGMDDIAKKNWESGGAVPFDLKVALVLQIYNNSESTTSYRNRNDSRLEKPCPFPSRALPHSKLRPKHQPTISLNS